ncbi:MAG: hypothetical protein N4A35_01935 [Flavobacteriales bacterium]|jgi:outer membrane protein assembly factor BamA|nr:hypothetical protein [Flavobacteriales bacterium]
MKRWLFILLFFVTSLLVKAQDRGWKFYVNDQEAEGLKLFNKLKIETYREQLKTIVYQEIEKGYLEASVDQVKSIDSLKEIRVKYHRGNSYKWASLKVEHEAVAFLSKVGYGEKLYSKVPFSPKEVKVLFQKTIKLLENSGYPFARIQLEDVELKKEGILAGVALDKGPLITIDSIYIKTNDKVSIPTVYNAIKLKPGDIYNEKALQEIALRIKEIPYLKESKGVEVEFINKKCNVYLYLNTVKSNNFNGVLGVQPDQNGAITLTGDVDVKLLNSFYKGEFIRFNWRQTQQLTQDLKLGFNYPFLFNTGFGVDTKLNIYKRDTTFVDANLRMGVDYVFSGMNKVMFFYENKNSNLLSTANYQNISVLPEYADVTKRNYGINVVLQNLDYRFNPRKGYGINIGGSVGGKRIKQNQALPEEIYENVRLNTFVYNIEGELRYFIPIKRKATIMLRGRGASFYNENVFTNELYRIGGIQTIRGFDEESIFVSSYAVASLEYRYLLEQNSNIYVFGDYGWLEKNVGENYLFDQPYSFGAGISFETSPGIFSLSYALGSQMGAPVYLRAAKIHFGFTSFF